ncbi:hypothetical protein GW17_00026702 [Ensete ventricosum]|nr:hypothetical protein GW17_00026702 [Ensete ventricosum]
MWSTRHSGAGLTQVWRGQQSYDRLNTGKMGKVDTPQLQETRRARHCKDHRGCDKVRWHAHTGLNQPCPLSRHGSRPRLLGRHKNFTRTFLALEGGPMSQECLFGNSGAKHRTEPKHPQQAEEVTTAGPTPNRFWRMMTDPRFPSPASNPTPFVVTAEAFLGLTNQVQALASMMQTIVPYLPQLIQSATQQSALPIAFPQTESPVAPNRETQLEVEPPQRQATEARAASPTAAPTRS